MFETLMKPPPHAPVKTRVAKEVHAAVEMARAHRAIVTVEGPVGVGKTTALAAEAERLRDDGAAAALVTAVQETGGNTKALYNDALERVRGYRCCGISETRRTFLDVAKSEDFILLVDEVQNLKPDVLNALRGAHDENGFGLVLCGNDTFINRFGAGHASRFAQLTSRLFHRFRVAPLSDDDMNRIAAASAGPIAPDAAAAAVAYASLHGSARALGFVLVKARHMAGAAPIALRHVEKAIHRREYRYLSPAILYDPNTGSVRRLRSAGLVHHPAMHLKAVASEGNAMPDDDPDAILATIAEALDMPADASLDDVLNAIRQLARSEKRDVAAARDARADVPAAAVAELLRDRNERNAQLAETDAQRRVEDALTRGYITPAMREWAVGLCRSDPASFDAFMTTAVPAWAHLTRPTGLDGRRPPARRVAGEAAADIATRLGLPPSALAEP